MYQLVKKNALQLIILWHIFFIYLIIFKAYKICLIDTTIEIFPAIDIAIIYYFSTYLNIREGMLFLIGFLIDQMHQIPFGMNSFIFVTINATVNFISRWLPLKNKVTNIVFFCLYSLFAFTFRYMIFLIGNDDFILQKKIVYSYYLTTITLYPLLQFILHKLFSKLTEHASK